MNDASDSPSVSTYMDFSKPLPCVLLRVQKGAGDVSVLLDSEDCDRLASNLATLVKLGQGLQDKNVFLYPVPRSQ
jgi:hypothetical protein